MSPRASLLPLALEGVTLELGGAARIRELDLVLGERGRTLVMGPNGAGKSLLLRLCHGLVRPTRGSITWRGAAGTSARDVVRRQAMVFQRPVLLRRSVGANLVYALAARGVPGREREPRARAALAGVGLAELWDRAARRLSGGEQQRVSLARAWALSPEVLFLDEPCANLDPAAIRAVEDAIAKIHAGGTRIIMASHDLAQARRLADDLVLLHRGRLLAHGPAAQTFEDPPTDEVRAFMNGELLA